MVLINYVITFLKNYFSSKNIILKFFSRLLNVDFEGNNFIGRNCIITDSSVGKYTYICNNCELYNCKIGRYCSIGNSVRLIRGSHPSHEFVSTSPMFFSKKHIAFAKTYVKDQLYDEYRLTSDGKSLKIGNDVWIGSDVDILEGCSIGNGAIVGAKALVTKDVPPYAIVVGVPAKIIRYRFPESEAVKMNGIKWWQWDEGKIMQHLPDFADYRLFLKLSESEN